MKRFALSLLIVLFSFTALNASDRYPLVGAGIGIGVLDWEFSQYGMAFNPKFQVKIGSCDNTFNFVTGVRYRYSSGYDNFGGQFLSLIERPWQKKKLEYTSMSSSQIQVPLQLRVNLTKSPYSQWYVSAGFIPNYNFASRIVDKQKGEVRPQRTIDNRLVHPFNCEAELMVGNKFGKFEFGVYFRYDLMPRYDASYIAQTYPQHGIVSGLASEKWRAGISLIYNFWLN